MRIVAYGCSMTAGTELGDHHVLGKSIAEVDTLKRSLGLQKWQQLELKYDLQTEGRRRSWPAHLARELQCEYLNLAQSGSSIDQCLLRMKNQLHNEDDLIIVGLTYIQRALRFSEEQEHTAKHQDLETACWNWFRTIESMCEMNAQFVDVVDCKAGLTFRYCKNRDLKAYCESVWMRAKTRLIEIERPPWGPLHANSHPYESWHIEVAKQMKEYLNEQTTT